MLEIERPMRGTEGPSPPVTASCFMCELFGLASECDWERNMPNPGDWLKLDSPQLHVAIIAELHNLAAAGGPL